MIKFFRKIRQNLLSKNKFGEYLIYAVGEIILVVIGILIALQIHDWNDSRKENIAEKKAYVSLNQDLKNELFNLNKYKSLTMKGLTYLEPIAMNNFENIDSLDYYLNISYRFVKNNPTYMSLKNTNSLKIIKNEDTRRILRYFYDSLYDEMKNIAESHSVFIQNQCKPFIIKNIPTEVSKFETMKFESSIEFKNLINFQIKYFKSNLNSFKTIDMILQNLIERTENKIKESQK